MKNFEILGPLTKLLVTFDKATRIKMIKNCLQVKNVSH